MADVFISYAREDRPFAARLAHALEAGGRSVWWDREILPGKDFAQLISAELNQAKAVVVIWSPRSSASRWVRDEASEGVERGVLVPVLMGAPEPPIGYRQIHAVDLTGWDGGAHPGLADLELAVDALRTGQPVPDRAEPEPEPIGEKRRAWPRLRWAALALLVVVGVGTGLALLPSLVQWRANPDRPPVPNGEQAASAPFRDCLECPQLVKLPAGSFTMGSSWFDRESQSDERPRVEVSVPRPFAIGRTEVTFEQWDVCVRAGGCNARTPDDSGFGRGFRPVIDVDWRDAQAFVAWLRQSTGKPYRLPTEAEWEYACRAGATTPYPFGETITPAVANYGRNEPGTREVGSYPPNGWGLYDMNGNVWEWVEDVWNDGHSGRPEDSSARTAGPDPQEHVIKGGSWDDRDRRARCTSRNGMDDTHRENEIGFRVALTLGE
ncbi:MAG: SUMF1/EgtB/PvdO family nonheme iron enzyme [Geminicoccaceae bacterium]